VRRKSECQRALASNQVTKASPRETISSGELKGARTSKAMYVKRQRIPRNASRISIRCAQPSSYLTLNNSPSISCGKSVELSPIVPVSIHHVLPQSSVCSIRSRFSWAVSGSSSTTTPGLPATREYGGMIVFGATTVPSSIRTQSLMIENLPCPFHMH
jgi:hypothetical protein